MRRITLLIVVLAVTPLTTVSAQDSVPVKPGDRVRITAPGVIAGMGAVTVVMLGRDTVVVTRAPNVWTVPLAAITRLEVSRGQRSNTVAKVGLGLLAGAAGAATGWVLLSSACSDDGSDGGFEIFDPSGVCGFFGGLLGGVLGFQIGASIGGSIKTDRWEEVPLDRLRVTPVPLRSGRVALMVSVAF